MDATSSLHPFGTPLPALTEDTIHKDKAIPIHEQIVKDENGKRRFHGAFTGGFSAGYWNTVGSQEGWTPQTFKSSRAEKAAHLQQKPSDFMDDEDLGEFGIAAQRIKLAEDYGGVDALTEEKSRKRKLMLPGSSLHIDTTEVLQKMFEPVKSTIGVKILKNMGWRPGQGVGPRLTKKEKKHAAAINKKHQYLMEKYGCTIETKSKDENTIAADSQSSDESSDDDEITFAPDDYEVYLQTPKLDKFGIGYVGLSREPVLSSAKPTTDEHFSLFGPLELLDKNNKKVSITGQAFGVGAFEEDDNDIYEKDDMTRYDFSLEDKKTPKEKKPLQEHNVLEGFVAAKNTKVAQAKHYDFDLPRDYVPRNWAERKSRFAPLDRATARALAKQQYAEEQEELTLEKRSLLLEGAAADAPKQPTPATEIAIASKPAQKNEQVEKRKTSIKSRDERTKELLELISAKSTGFVRGGIIETDGKETATTSSSTSDSASGSFQPFAYDEAKQKRYDQFVAANARTEAEINTILSKVQPVHLSEWDREMEKKEFIQAQKLYKPLEGSMANRFVTETSVLSAKPAPIIDAADPTKTVSVVRTKNMWKPNSLLCKRFNIAEPFGGGGGDSDSKQNRQMSNKSKLSVFDYLEGSINTKSNFITPVIIPKHIDRPKELLKTAVEARTLNKTKSNDDDLGPSTSAAAKALQSAADIPQKSTDATTTPDESAAAATALSANMRRLTFTPKTELEKRAVECIDMPRSENLELFNAIFDESDDEDESTSLDATEQQAQIEANLAEAAKNAAREQLLSNKTAAAANLVRNTSPPRGIFAALFTASTSEPKNDAAPVKNAATVATVNSNKFAAMAAPKKLDDAEYEPAPKIKFTRKADRNQTETQQQSNASDTVGVEVMSVDAYGPAIPQNLSKQSEIVATTVEVPAPMAQSISYKGLQIIEQWVEKGENGSSNDSESSSSSSSGAERKHKRSKKSKKNKKSATSSSRKDKKTHKKKKKKEKEKEKHKTHKHKKR